MSDEALARVRKACRAMVTRRALVSSCVSVVPVPGLDLAVDVGLLMELTRKINERHGLSHEQVEAMDPSGRQLAFRLIQEAGASLVGKVVTKDLVLAAAKRVGLALTAKQAAKYAPIIGSAVCAGISFVVMQWMMRQHIEQCQQVARQLRLDMAEAGGAGESGKVATSPPREPALQR